MIYGRYIYTYYGLKTNKHHWGGTTLYDLVLYQIAMTARHGAPPSAHSKARPLWGASAIDPALDLAGRYKTISRGEQPTINGHLLLSFIGLI
jgi:hypothetical protein